MRIFPEEDGLDTAREKLEEGKEIERKKRMERRSFKDDLLMQDIVRKMESRESSLQSPPPSPSSFSMQGFFPPNTPKSVATTSRQSTAHSSSSPRTPLAVRFSKLQLSPRTSPVSDGKNVESSPSLLSLAAIESNEKSLSQLQKYDKEDDEGVRMMWEQGRTLKTLQSVYGPSLQKTFVDRIVANATNDAKNVSQRGTFTRLSLANGDDVEQKYQSLSPAQSRADGRDMLRPKQLYRPDQVTWQEMVYHSAWEKGVKLNMKSAAFQNSNNRDKSKRDSGQLEAQIHRARVEHENRMAKLKLKYGRLDSLPPMLSPRTMFASTHILHTLKKGDSSEENKVKRDRYAAYR